MSMYNPMDLETLQSWLIKSKNPPQDLATNYMK